ncbi:MAG: tetratricopeptide repeat protein [Alphaproteobacteria bacterium]|nr:tetratricopeptide repeat protein [Alphaproteobacteria bacterium]MDE1930389.1 tetratricopeptide repeat protein [Alphaproteobacteria bacterium]
MTRIAVRWCHAVALVITFLAVAGSSRAQSRNDDWARCYGVDADAAIVGCSAILSAGQGASVELAVAALNRAIAYDAKGAIDRAIADYSLAIRLQPDFGKALDRRGLDYTRQAKYDSAIADFSAAVKLAPNDQTAFNARGVAYSDKREYRRAIADFTVAIRLNPGDIQALINRGHSHVDVGDYDDAVADYGAAIRLDPNNAAAFNYRGVAYNRSGDHDRAIADYSAAIRLRPDYAVAFADRGNAYRDKHEYAPAIADYDEAIRLDPSYADAFGGRGFVYMQTGQVDRARDDLKAALRLNPNLAEAHFGLSVIAFTQRDYPTAIGEIDVMMKLTPGNLNVLYARGLYELFDGKYQTSVTDFAVANWYALNGSVVPVPLSLGLVLAVVGAAAAARPRSYWPGAVRALIRHIADVTRLTALRWRRLAVNAAIPFVLSVGAAVGATLIDRLWYSLWLRVGVPTLLIPTSGSAIVLGLCLQVFAVRAHQIAGEAQAETGFWIAYGRFNAYAVSLFATGYAGAAAALYILTFYSQTLLQRHLLNVPVFWLAFSLIALVGVLALGLVARCSLMLPAAALGHPLSPRRAWQMQRGSTSQLSLVVSLSAVFGAGLSGLLGQALARVPPSALPPWPRNLAAIVAAQFSLYLAVALVAVTLSLFYRERLAATRIEAAALQGDASAGPLADEA